MPPRKGAKGKAKGKKLSPAKAGDIKAKAKRKTAPVAAPLIVRAKRLKRQNSADAFGDFSIISEADYEPFPKPAGAPTAGARGCKSAEVTLGPIAGWPEFLQGTDAAVIYPDAITDVRAELNDAKYHWKSGHVINADFGGSGIGNKNMTCLTSSANTSQTAFDNSIKNARSALHRVYSTIREAGAQHEFFAGLGYGIKLEIVLSDAAWAATYPENCVSDQMSLTATIVSEPSEADIRAAMGGATEMTVQQALTAVQEVKTLVAKANQTPVIYNTK